MLALLQTWCCRVVRILVQPYAWVCHYRLRILELAITSFNTSFVVKKLFSSRHRAVCQHLMQYLVMM